METRNNNPQTTGLQTFLNENIGAEIRTITVDEMLYFVGRDIALSLGPQIRDFPHEVLQTEEKCAFD